MQGLAWLGLRLLGQTLEKLGRARLQVAEPELAVRILRRREHERERAEVKEAEEHFTAA